MLMINFFSDSEFICKRLLLLCWLAYKETCKKRALKSLVEMKGLLHGSYKTAYIP